MTWIYYSTLCRFDEFIPGVAVAMLKNFHRPTWDRLMARGGAVFAVGGVATLAMLVGAARYDEDDSGRLFFMTAFGYSLLAMAFALLVVAALSPARTPLAWRVPGAASIASWSYSIYLSHKPLAMFLARQMKPLDPPEAVRLAVVAPACIVVGWLLYRVLEAPFMALRDRRWPSNFRPADAAADRAPAGAAGGRPVSARVGASP
jgi:peptidoglycan/LPS O-acetylase OafA/YrhL